MSAESERDNYIRALAECQAERDLARVQRDRAMQALRSIERDSVSNDLWLRQKAHDALAALVGETP